MVLRDWLGADVGVAGDDDEKERYLIGLCGGGIYIALGGPYRDFLCGGGHLSDCAYSVG